MVKKKLFVICVLLFLADTSWCQVDSKINLNKYCETELQQKELIRIAKKMKWPLQKKNSNGEILKLIKISKNEKPVYEIKNNKLGQPAVYVTRVNTLHNQGALGLNLEGQGLVTAIWDEKIPQITHEAYNDNNGTRVSDEFTEGYNTNTPPTLSGHSTGVIGIIMSSDYDGKISMAPKSSGIGFNAFDTLTNYSLDHDILASSGDFSFSNTNSIPLTSLQSKPVFPLVSNHSYITSYGVPYDNVANKYKYHLPCIAFGNIATQKPAKSYNSMIVGLCLSAHPNSATVPEDEPGSIGLLQNNHTNSEYRILPNIIAPSRNITPFPTDLYGILGGTSGSSPQVAGGAIILQQLYGDYHPTFMKSSTVKALMIHTAQEAGPIGPDMIFGFGLLNLENAANVIMNETLSTEIIEDTLANGTTNTYTVTASNSKPLEITLAWLNPNGNDTIIQLHNDLDVVVKLNNTIVGYPWSMDLTEPLVPARVAINTIKNTKDNVEKIQIMNPVPGQTYTIEVSHTGSLWETQCSTIYYQSCSLASTNSVEYSLIISGINNCPSSSPDDTLNIIQPITSGNITEHANLDLLASNIITGANTDVQYLAGRDVILQHGFESNNYNTMIKIQECLNPDLSGINYNPINRPIYYWNSSSPRPENPAVSNSIMEKILEKVSVYPNPTNGIVRINPNGTGDGRYEVRDTHGTLLFLGRFDSDEVKEIDLSQLARGLYFVTVSNPLGIKSHKIILK
jgi:hypothetical protein